MLTLHPHPSTSAPRPAHSRSLKGRWLAAWLGMAALGVTNGVLREVTYQPHVGERTGHQISTFTLMALIAGYVWWLQRRWPLLSDRQAVSIGVTWALMTLAFEFGFGHYVDGLSWEKLVADYDLTAGNLWVLVPLTVALAPSAARRLQGGGPR
jgi:hypothetical protein